MYPSLVPEVSNHVKVISIGQEGNNSFFFHPQIQNQEDLDEGVVISLLTDVVDKLQKEKQNLCTKQAHFKVGQLISLKSLLCLSVFILIIYFHVFI